MARGTAEDNRGVKKTPAIDATETGRVALDSSFLRGLLGYNTRRATLRIFELFHQRMREHGLNPVEFSVLSLMGYNPGVTAGQICQDLSIPAPMLAKILARLGTRKLFVRKATAADGRAFHLSLTASGRKLLAEVEPVIAQLEIDASARLTPKQRETINELLQRVYD